MTTVGTPVSFGTYTFPDTITEFDYNFGQTEPASVKLPGMDGAWSDDGDQAARTTEGQVNIRLYLTPVNKTEMDDRRDALGLLVSNGLQKLIYQPTRPGDSRRFCWARLASLQMPRSAEDYSDHYQEVEMEFQVPRPVWLVNRYAGWEIGDEHTIGEAGLDIGEGGLEFNISGLTNDLTVTNLGNTTALCTVVVQPQTAQSCQNPRVQRVSGGFIYEEFQYLGTLTALQDLTVNGENQQARLNAALIFGANFKYTHPAFIRLAPGANTIRVQFQNVGDAARITFFYHDTYR